MLLFSVMPLLLIGCDAEDCDFGSDGVPPPSVELNLRHMHINTLHGSRIWYAVHYDKAKSDHCARYVKILGLPRDELHAAIQQNQKSSDFHIIAAMNPVVADGRSYIGDVAPVWWDMKDGLGYKYFCLSSPSGLPSVARATRLEILAINEQDGKCYYWSYHDR